jgi:preprotein translocase subunit SecA
MKTLLEFLEEKQEYRQYLNRVVEAFSSPTTRISSIAQIRNYSLEDLENYVNALKSDRSLFVHEKVLIETLAVIKRAAELAYGFEIRDAQMLALIAFVKKDSREHKGVIEEILTGEGKTVTIAMLAALKYLETGKKIDIATSSTELAKRDASDQKAQEFYSSLKITATHNIGDQSNCYAKDIVYGVSNTFEGDWLREYYKGQNILHGRRAEESILIVDEVDNMFVDNKSSVTLLSENFVGSNKIKIVLRLIWYFLCRLDEKQSGPERIINKAGQLCA